MILKVDDEVIVVSNKVKHFPEVTRDFWNGKIYLGKFEKEGKKYDLGVSASAASLEKTVYSIVTKEEGQLLLNLVHHKRILQDDPSHVEVVKRYEAYKNRANLVPIDNSNLSSKFIKSDINEDTTIETNTYLVNDTDYIALSPDCKFMLLSASLYIFENGGKLVLLINGSDRYLVRLIENRLTWDKLNRRHLIGEIFCNNIMKRNASGDYNYINLDFPNTLNPLRDVDLHYHDIYEVKDGWFITDNKEFFRYIHLQQDLHEFSTNGQIIEITNMLSHRRYLLDGIFDPSSKIIVSETIDTWTYQVIKIKEHERHVVVGYKERPDGVIEYCEIYDLLVVYDNELEFKLYGKIDKVHGADVQHVYLDIVGDNAHDLLYRLNYIPEDE